ncbi:hypothetical protein SAMN05660209_00074 [Geodermatophilus africanus]|uniref:Uncharacterized protein n=1 Tax=Geodermatophilus africanus TaxID=1137993 RepID=A0A1H3AJK9_9ACTN|nr:hypothetical protein [Geodermatophilus africanus]SDX29785.1 hypothetical protein SAMN05660209_00074 [Geodermatophilus africanus]
MAYDAPPNAYPQPQGTPPPQGPWPQEPSPQDGTTQRGGFLGFMTSLPGVLTAVAGLVTAVTGGVGLYLSQDDGSDPGPSDTYITVEAAPVPEGEGEVDADELQAGVPGASGDDEVTALVEDCLNGDYSACDTLLYTLADECSAGYPLSCDVLYQVSAVGSAYEDYGATCGGRVYDWTYAGVCSEV